MGRLIQQYRNYLLSVANRKMDRDIGGKLGASDIVQESMITAHQNFPQFQGDEKKQFLAWLRQILVNDLYHARRSYKGTQKRHVARERPLQFNSSHDLPLVDPQLTPQTNAMAFEEANLLKHTISQLPTDYQTVLQLRSFEGKEFSEIAIEMSRSPEAVRKLWTRAVLRLQQAMTNLSANPECKNHG